MGLSSAPITAWFKCIGYKVASANAQLNVATAFVQTLFTGIVIAISLAIGLAFGLGGQEAAARYIEHLRKDIPHTKHDSDNEDEK